MGYTKAAKAAKMRRSAAAKKGWRTRRRNDPKYKKVEKANRAFEKKWNAMTKKEQKAYMARWAARNRKKCK